MKANQKIKISSNESSISTQKSNIVRTSEIMNEILGVWAENGVELTDEEINSLINSTFGNVAIEKIATQRSANLRPRDQVEEYTSWIDDINLAFSLYPGLSLVPFSPYIYCEKGKILTKKGALKEIEELYTYYITETKDIELYNRHIALIDELNNLSREVRENTGSNLITSAWLIKYDLEGSAFIPSTFKYGK